MNILYDSAMPFAEAFFEGLGQLQCFTAGNMDERALAWADILLVRSTTKVDASLLNKASNLKVVGTATAGFDHFDIPSLERSGIKWMASPGCNARAVAEYVFCALLTKAHEEGFVLSDRSLGVVGVGQVGSRVAKLMQHIGMRVFCYDPPRSIRDEQFQSDDFADILGADVISLHVPLTDTGDFPTFHMFNGEVAKQLTSSQIVVNACRGDVVDLNALMQRQTQTNACSQPTEQLTLVTDCWPQEPLVSKNAIDASSIATAHIAGHTLEGKARGTESLYQQLCRLLNKEATRKLTDFLPELKMTDALRNALINIEEQGVTQQTLFHLSQCFYNIREDDTSFRQFMMTNDSFGDFRRNYPVRREFDALTLTIQNRSAAQQLSELGFSVI